MILIFRTISLIALGLGLMACQGKFENFGYYINSPQKVTMNPQVKQLGSSAKVDMLWVIGGMSEQSYNFQIGVTTFMQSFVQNKMIDWRMGVISTDPQYAPFLGMGSSGVFDVSSPNPSLTLVTAVMSVLQSYDGEQLFDPTVKALSEHKDFLRTDATLAIILTNDAHDSSKITVDPQDMLNFLAQVKGGLGSVIVYGIFGSTDLKCPVGTIDEDWNYAGSPMETVIKATGGQGLSLCSNTFGNSLAQIGDHLIKHILHSEIYLARKPIASTIQITYMGKVLPGGPKDQGGFWFYDVSKNSIVFYDLSFATNDTDSVNITYTEDIGISG